MTWDEYQKAAAKTLPLGADIKRLLTIGAFNLWEAGEVGNIIKKVVEHGWNLDEPRKRLDGNTPREAIEDEIGDVLWALGCIASTLGLLLEDCAKGNIEKLRSIHGSSFNADAIKERGR